MIKRHLFTKFLQYLNILFYLVSNLFCKVFKYTSCPFERLHAGQKQTWFSHLHPDLLLEKQFDPDTKCVEIEGVKVREVDDKNMEKSYPQLVKGFKAKLYFTVSFCNPSLLKTREKGKEFFSWKNINVSNVINTIFGVTFYHFITKTPVIFPIKKPPICRH